MSIKITISDPKGKLKAIRVNGDDLIKTCKENSGYSPASKWRWTFNGDILDNDKTIKDYDFEEDDKIICSEEVIGGK